MKYPVDKCECGLDLTTATPVRIILGKGPNGEPIANCPDCCRTHAMIEEPAAGPIAEPTPEPVAELEPLKPEPTPVSVSKPKKTLKP